VQEPSRRQHPAGSQPSRRLHTSGAAAGRRAHEGLAKAWASRHAFDYDAEPPMDAVFGAAGVGAGGSGGGGQARLPVALEDDGEWDRASGRHATTAFGSGAAANGAVAAPPVLAALADAPASVSAWADDGEEPAAWEPRQQAETRVEARASGLPVSGSGWDAEAAAPAWVDSQRWHDEAALMTEQQEADPEAARHEYLRFVEADLWDRTAADRTS
jgi:hypothetical protein